jgi:branched-chain amino acid transport system ATP-binding protein
MRLRASPIPQSDGESAGNLAIGLAPIVVENLFAALLAIRDNAGVTMILAEQKVDLALTSAEDALVLERGRIAFRGKTADLREDEALQHRLLAIGEL